MLEWHRVARVLNLERGEGASAAQREQLNQALADLYPVGAGG